MRSIAILSALLSLPWPAAAVSEHAHGPYAGQHTRAIKSLSAAEVAALTDGAGAGFAKAAELNGYPGPAHVIELAAPLQLDARQREATQQLMAEHRARARQLGAELVAAEAELDRLFARRQADVRQVDEATQRVGALQARLRAEHLNTHLAQTSILSEEQVSRYAVLRGYAPAAAAAAMIEGEVRKVDTKNRRITLRHAEITSLDMPPMTMVFRVREPALIRALKTGDKVRFSAERSQGSFWVTALEAVR